MPKYQTTKGLVIRETQYKDNDKLLTLLTEDYGLMTVKARGVKRKNSTLRSACQLMCYSEFTLFENKGFYTINEAEQLQMFIGLRTNIELLALGSYFCQLLETVSGENTPEPELLRLALNCLFAMDKLQKPQKQIKSAFELRLLKIIGLGPELSNCNMCGSSSAGRFWLREGKYLCNSCSSLYGEGTVRTPSTQVLAAMQYILECDIRRLLAFSLPEAAYDELCEISETYLLEQLEQSFSSLSFYKRLFRNIGGTL